MNHKDCRTLVIDIDHDPAALEILQQYVISLVIRKRYYKVDASHLATLETWLAELQAR